MRPSGSGARRAASRLADLLFVVLVLAAAGLALSIAERLRWSADWTLAARNSLSAPTRALLARLDGPLTVSAFVRESGLAARAAGELLDRYRRLKPDLEVEWVDPDRAPQRTREAGVSSEGELLVAYRGRRARARELSEAALTSALHRVARGGERRVAFLTGHGERDLLGRANHDLGSFGQRLEERGFRLQPLDLAALGAVPENIAVLVVSSPAVDLLAGEAEALVGYLRGGGNLLWLADPGGERRLAALAGALGVRLVPGTVIDPRAVSAGIADPAFVPAGAYGDHPLLAGFRMVTLFPLAAGIEVEGGGWRATPLVRSGTRSWASSAPRDGELRFTAGRDTRGPLALAVALSRRLDEVQRERHPGRREQRVVVVGDGDFLSNTYLGNGGNLDLGLRILEWLAGEDALVEVPARRAPDLQLTLSRPRMLVIGLGALLGLPGLLLAGGALVWRTRRRR